MAAVLLMTLRGTPFLYQGEELGLLESRVPFSRIQDPPGRRFWPFYKGRDGCRTPLPWSAGPSAGFTTGLPWLPVDPAHAALHAEGQRADPGSVLNLYRRCIALRKAHPALQTGDFAFHDAGDDDSVAWLRSLGSERLVVLLNFARSARSLRLPGDAPHEVRLSTAPGIEGRFVGRVELPGEAALVLETLAG
jgi:alpha-glucosidase